MQVYLVLKLCEVRIDDIDGFGGRRGKCSHCLDVSTRLLFTTLRLVGTTSDSDSSDESTFIPKLSAMGHGKHRILRTILRCCVGRDCEGKSAHGVVN